MLCRVNHFTNQTGFNAIRSQKRWLFKASQPPATHNPRGAYFTTYGPDEPRLADRLRIPREKLRYLFSFMNPGDLLPLPGGRGRLRTIFYSPDDYSVEQERQEFHGRSGLE